MGDDHSGSTTGPGPISVRARGRRTAWALRVLTLVLVLSGLLARSGAGAAPPQLTPPLVPDPHLTPGATLDVTTDDICVPGYAKKVRNVPGAIKQQAYTAYGI